MLSPATFIGIAKATAPIAPPTARPATIQPVRVPGSLQPIVPTGQPPSKPPTMASPESTTTPPPRNLPRGSLLDLSV